MVDPLPDEAALAARVALEQLLVVGEATRPVAHRVRVLAEQERHPAPARVQSRVVQRDLLPTPDRVDLLVRGVHAAVDVDVAAGPVVLVVQRARGIARARPRGHRRQVAPHPALVAERPHDDARVVLVALDHPPHAVDERVLPRRVVGRVPAPPQRHEPVRLEVALVDHVEPELVAEVEEARVRRIVAGAHRVDVVRLHQLDVAAHHRDRHGAAGERIELVPVDAVELHTMPIDLQQPVLDHHPPEADPQRHPLPRAHDRRVVEPRDLRAPGLDALDRHGRPRERVDPKLRHEHSRGDTRHIDPQPPRPRHVVVVGVHEDVVERRDGPPDQRHVAKDPGQPPHVLVLDVGARRPLVHPHREHVLDAGPEQLADRELGRQPAAPRRPHIVAVDPHARAGIDALEAQDGVAREVLRHDEAHAVVARRVLVGHERRLDRERVAHVRVRGRAVVVQLPVRRHRQPVPAGLVIPTVDEVRGQVGARRPPKGPVAVEVQPRRVAVQPRPRGAHPLAWRAFFEVPHRE